MAFSNCTAADYLAAPEQLSYGRLSVLADGGGNGQRIIDVASGTGINCTITPDRGMNIVECFYRGIPVAFRAPGGHHPATGDFQKDWPGGLMTLCGLRNIGAASGGEPKHGRISQLAAENMSISRVDGGLRIAGEICEGWLFGPNLLLSREYFFPADASEIVISDRVTNRGSEAENIAILYHFNFGYPLVSPAVVMESCEHRVAPRDEIAAAGLQEWMKMDAPQAGYKEQCFLHYLPPDASGRAEFAIANPETGIRVALNYAVSTLPHMVEWKNCCKNGYVLGLEPGNGSLTGRENDIKSGLLPELLPGKSIDFEVTVKFSAC